jgi:hypothetical protein
MSWFPRPARPSTVIADLRAFAGGPQRHKLLFGFLAVLMPAIIIYGFYVDGRTGILPGKQFIYVADFSDSRTDAEIVASQKIDLKNKAIADAEKRAAYRRLADRLGIEYKK